MPLAICLSTASTNNMSATDFPQEQEQQDPAVVAVAVADRLQAFGASLASRRDQWIRARAATGWDKRVAQDIDQYHSKDAANKMAANMMESVQQGYPITTREARAHRSTVFVGITRQKTNAADARLSDILLPTDDKNWGIQPTPDPEGARAMENNGQLIDPVTQQPVMADAMGNIVDAGTPGAQPLTHKVVAQAAQWIAHKAAKAMELKIDEQLVECNYNSELRKMLHNGAVMGTGVMKGPVVTKRIRKAWRETAPDADGKKIQALEIVEELSPASFSIDPRMVWEDPSCGDDVKNGQGVYELELMTPRQVKELAKQPGYLLDQLRQVVLEGPKPSAAMTETRQQIDDHNQEQAKTFQRWTYWGELEPEDLQAAGVDISNAEDPLQSFCGCVEMVNNTVIRAYMNPLENSPIPYDFFPWEKVQGSARGYGIPYLMRSQQSVTNAAWRQMMDNSGVTSGPQIIVKQSAVLPADGQWKLTPFKFWYAADDNVDVTKAFAAVEFESHQPELSAIIKLAEDLGDQETATPMMAQGQQGSAPDTVGGMQMLMNNANVVLRRLVKQFDDYVTKPHIRRYYDYNMMYSEEEEIKGDFNIDARGSSALIIRDIQNQAFLGLLQTAVNPVFAPMLDLRTLFKKALQAQHIDPEDIMLTEQQVAANEAKKQPPPPPYQIQVAEIKAAAETKIAQGEQAASQAEVQSRENTEQADRQLRVAELQLTRDIAVMKQAGVEKVSVAQINAELAQATMADRTRKELAAANLTFAEHNPKHHGVDSVAPQPQNHVR
jgi:hypothetical protein